MLSPQLEEFETWGEFERSSPPVLPPRKSELMMLVDDDSFWAQPRDLADAPKIEELHEEALGFWEGNYQIKAIYPAGHGDRAERFTGTMLLFMGLIAMVFAIAGAMIVIPAVY